MRRDTTRGVLMEYFRQARADIDKALENLLKAKEIYTQAGHPEIAEDINKFMKAFAFIQEELTKYRSNL